MSGSKKDVSVDWNNICRDSVSKQGSCTIKFKLLATASTCHYTVSDGWLVQGFGNLDNQHKQDKQYKECKNSSPCGSVRVRTQPRVSDGLVSIFTTNLRTNEPRDKWSLGQLTMINCLFFRQYRFTISRRCWCPNWLGNERYIVGWLQVLACPRLDDAGPQHAVHYSSQHEYARGDEEHNLPRLTGLLEK